MAREDLAPGSIATLACSYANVCSAAAAAATEWEFDPERLAAGRTALVELLAGGFGCSFADLWVLVEAIGDVDHPAAEVIGAGLREAYYRGKSGSDG